MKKTYKFIQQYFDKFDTIFGFIAGVGFALTLLLNFDTMTTYKEAITLITPYLVPLVQLLAFAYCIRQASIIALSEKKHIPPKGILDFLSNGKGVVVLAWITGGLIFLLSASPEMVSNIANLLLKD